MNKQEAVQLIFIMLFLIIGALCGYALGDVAIKNSLEVRPKDWIECRILFPVIGAVIGTFVSFPFSAWMIDVFKVSES